MGTNGILRRLIVILLLSGWYAFLYAQTFHALFLETEAGFAAPQYGADAAFRTGYELKHRHLIIHLALGTAFTYTIRTMPDYDETTPAVDTEEYRLLAHAFYTRRKDARSQWELQTPILVGAEWENKCYFLLGAIPAFRVFGKTDINADIRVAGEYEKFIDFFENMPNHGFTTMPYTTTETLPLAANLYAAAEIGVPCGEYIRLAAYARYPVIHSTSTDAWSAGIKITARIAWLHNKHYPCRCIIQ